MTTVRPAEASESDSIAASLANAFSEDPFFGWVAGAGPNRPLEPRLRIMFGRLAGLEFERPDPLVFTSDDGAGAAIWKLPNQWKMPAGEMMRAFPAMLRAFGLRTPRMLGAISAIEKVHPAEEHYYLEAIGTRRDMQSKGVGSALISHMLDRCDREGMPAYLESSNLQNVPFYARHGFEATGEIATGKGAPTVTAMWRRPR